MDILKKPYVWSFMGQVKNKPTRERMLLELQKLNYPNFLHITEKWGDENQIDIKEYKKILSDSIFCPCPSGWGGANGLKDCFRLYEALEAGSIPIVEMDSHQYFNKFFPDNILLQVKDDWSTVADDIQEILGNERFLLDYHKKLMQWWSGIKNEIKLKIQENFQINRYTSNPHSDDQVKIENSISQSRHPGFQDFLNFLKKTNINSMAEVGVFKGESTIHYANIVNKIYAIDPWLKDYDSNDKAASLEMGYIEQCFDDNISSFNNIIKIKDLSINACKLIPDNSLDLVYLDAGHSYESVKEDLSHWIPKINNNGYIAGHDYFDETSECYKKNRVIHWSGVARAVDEIVGKPKFRFGDSSWAQQLNITHTSKKLAIVIQSCDHYDFLWDGWKDCFLKNWDFSIPAKIYFCTEDKDFICDAITNIKTGKCETENIKGASTFSSRMKNAIEQIDADYILYLQEDMWLHKPIDSSLFNQAFEYCINENLNVLNFGYKLGINRKFNMNGETFSIDDFKEYTNTYINGKRVYNRLCSVNHLKSHNPFSVTHHSCFFKKDFLQKYLCVEGENPIDNEVKSSHRIFKDYINQNAKIQGIDHKWYEHVCESGKLNDVGESLIHSKAIKSPKSYDLNISIMNVPMGSDIIKKWVNIHENLKSGKNILCVGGDLFPVSNSLDINHHLGEYIDEDVDMLLSKHNYSDWGQPLGSSLNSCFIYLKSTPLVHKMTLELVNICLELNLEEDLRFFSYRERHFDYNLEKLIKNYGDKINVKTIDNDKFAVSEEIYGKNIKHYKSNPPAYINFDRNVYTEELKKVYFSK